MTEQLQSMLREAADDRPDLELRDDPWRRGRRIRLGRRLAGFAGAMVTAAAVAVSAVLLTTPDLTPSPSPADEDSVPPALPDTLYEVPPNIPDISDDPLDEPAALVYHGSVRTGWFSGAERPLVVGAESGAVRAVRDAGSTDQAALSPDGTKLAVGDRWGSGPEPNDGPPTVLVVDLRSGESATYTLPDEGLGGGIEELTWAPDSSRLAVTTNVITGIRGSGHSSEWIPGWLDLPSGEWDEHGMGEVLAISPDGEQIAVDASFRPTPDNRHTVTSIDGPSSADVELELGVFGVGFSPDGRQIATVVHPGNGYTPSDPYQLKVYDAATGDLVVQLELGAYSRVNLLGWGERGILVETARQLNTADGENPTSRTGVERIDLSDADDPVRSVLLVGRSYSSRIGIPAAFLDADVRPAQPLEAPFDWIGRAPLLILLGIIAVWIVYLRRRRPRVSSGRGSATGLDSSGR